MKNNSRAKVNWMYDTPQKTNQTNKKSYEVQFAMPLKHNKAPLLDNIPVEHLGSWRWNNCNDSHSRLSLIPFGKLWSGLMIGSCLNCGVAWWLGHVWTVEWPDDWVMSEPWSGLMTVSCLNCGVAWWLGHVWIDHVTKSGILNTTNIGRSVLFLVQPK